MNKFPKEIVLSITPNNVEDAIEAVKHENVCQSCVVAQALKTQFPQFKVWVGISTITLRNNKKEVEYHCVNANEMMRITARKSSDWKSLLIKEELVFTKNV